MKSRLWFTYSLICTCTMMYLCWKMGTMTSEPRYRVFCQQYMKQSREDTPHIPIGYNASQQPKPDVVYPTTTRTEPPTTIFPPTIVDGRDINYQIASHFTIRQNEKKDKFINLHMYNYTINSNVCHKNKLFLILVVHSAPVNRLKRDAIRQAYGSVTSYKDLRLGLVFMLGAVKKNSLHTAIHKESHKHGDIVQGNFPDSYKSLNRKHIMAMHWYLHNCNAHYILKLDDDTFVNPYRIVDYILVQRPVGMAIHCKLISGEGPLRSVSSKWYTPIAQYPFSIFPPFCLGFAYITTPQAWSALYRVSKDNRLMDMDDLYVTVALAMKAGVRRVDMNDQMLPCSQNMSEITLEKLNEMAVLLDRRNQCSTYAFGKWRDVQRLNEHNQF